MKQEDKELLLKDLCARLPYGVYGNYLNSDGSLSDDELLKRVKIGYRDLICANGRDGMVLDGFLKPYLFPLSSMTEEQKIGCFKGTPLEIDKYGDVAVKDDFYGNSQYTDLEIYLEVIDWLNKNHFDYRDLIKKGLAIDATGLNIYKEETK